MLQTISPLDLRQKTGGILDQALYRKSRFLVKRKNKAIAVLMSYVDYQRFVEDEDGEIYSDEQVSDFMKSDELTSKQKQAVKEILMAVK